jgi:predicted PurR-regulated permease PerM
VSESFKTIASWLTTSGIKILGILITLFILFPMSRRIVKWLEKIVPDKDPHRVLVGGEKGK